MISIIAHQGMPRSAFIEISIGAPRHHNILARHVNILARRLNHIYIYIYIYILARHDNILARHDIIILARVYNDVGAPRQ